MRRSDELLNDGVYLDIMDLLLFANMNHKVSKRMQTLLWDVWRFLFVSCSLGPVWKMAKPPAQMILHDFDILYLAIVG